MNDSDKYKNYKIIGKINNFQYQITSGYIKAFINFKDEIKADSDSTYEKSCRKLCKEYLEKYIEKKTN